MNEDMKPVNWVQHIILAAERVELAMHKVRSHPPQHWIARWPRLFAVAEHAVYLTASLLIVTIGFGLLGGTVAVLYLLIALLHAAVTGHI